MFLGYCLPLFLRLYIVLINTILFLIIVDYCFEKTILCLEYNILDTERAPPLPLQLRPRACKRASARPACLCTLHEVPPGADALARRAKAPGEEGVRAARRGGGGGAGGGGPAPEPQPRAPRPSHGPCECSRPSMSHAAGVGPGSSRVPGRAYTPPADAPARAPAGRSVCRRSSGAAVRRPQAPSPCSCARAAC